MNIQEEYGVILTFGGGAEGTKISRKKNAGCVKYKEGHLLLNINNTNDDNTSKKSNEVREQ